MWLYITLPLVAVIIITAAVFILCKRTKDKKTEKSSSDAASPRPTETLSVSENQQEEVDPENDVAYASISYTKKSNNSKVKPDDEGDAVTYRTPSTDNSCLYASIMKWLVKMLNMRYAFTGMHCWKGIYLIIYMADCMKERK